MTATVLIVDDDPDILDLLSALLTEEGFQTVAVSDGLTALRLISTNRPALAIIDLAMPIMDGQELIERLRKEPGEPLPIIAMSAALYAPPPDLPHVDAYLAKPFDLEELMEHVHYLAHCAEAPEAQRFEAQPSFIPLRQRIPGSH
jgi:DNA-binding response OmpR family regulator